MEKDWLFIDNNEIINDKKGNLKIESREIDNLNYKPKIINNDILQNWNKQFNLIPLDCNDNTEDDYKIDISDNNIIKEEKNLNVHNKLNSNLKIIYQNYKKNKFICNSIIFSSIILYYKLNLLNSI